MTGARPIYSVLLVSAAKKINTALMPFFPPERFEPVTVADSAARARRILADRDYDFVIINAPLPDEFGRKLAVDVCIDSERVALLLVRSDMYDEIRSVMSAHGVLVTKRPMERSVFKQLLDSVQFQRYEIANRKFIKGDNKESIGVMCGIPTAILTLIAVTHYSSNDPGLSKKLYILSGALALPTITFYTWGRLQKGKAKRELERIADEYNKPFSNEPDEFVSIRQQIKHGRGKDMMAVVYDIEKVEWPTAKHGPKGADDEDEIKNTTNNFNDCTHWYKALAYLKKGDKESAINELNELIEQGHNEILVERATDLLNEIKK